MTSAESAHSHLKLVASATDQGAGAATIPSEDRRAHRRLTVSELSWLNHVRIKYGPDVSLIDLSPGGVQLETTSPLLPASTVVIELTAGNKTWPVPARVLRCHVASVVPRITYRGGLAFKRPFQFEEVAAVAESAADVNPVHEYARLNLALNRVGEESPSVGPLTATGRGALQAAFAMIESARGRESAAPFVREFGRLMRLLTMSVENATDAATVIPEVITRLHRSVPSLSVRLIDPGHAPMIGPDAVFFRVPTEGADAPDRLVIEFPQDCALEVWHLQLLEAAAHLLTVSKDLSSSRERASRMQSAPQVPDVRPSPERNGWNRLVVRYLDGRLLKGYGRDFLPARGSLDLWNDPDGQPDSRITIPFAHLKAVFFVHDFDGDPEHTEAVDAEDPSLRGRRITVTFLDGEVLRGVTLGYSQSAPGFFVSPLDNTGNNAKVFVLAAAVRHVQLHDSSSRTSEPQPALSMAR